MFSNSYQSGFVSVFFSVGSNPLALWDSKVKNGHIRRVIDDEVKSLVLEISGTNVATTFITCPIKPRASLGIRLPYFVMVLKNMKKYFTFEIEILDDKDMRRRFRVSNFQSTTKVLPFCTTMPIGLNAGWNQVQFNLADFTKRAYGSTYIETVRVQIHANVRIRRLYFTDHLFSDDEMPNEFKLFAPQKKKEAAKSTDKAKPSEEKAEEEIPPPPSPIEEVAPPAEPVDKSKASPRPSKTFDEGAEMRSDIAVEDEEEEEEEEDEAEEEFVGGAEFEGGIQHGAEEEAEEEEEEEEIEDEEVLGYEDERPVPTEVALTSEEQQTAPQTEPITADEEQEITQATAPTEKETEETVIEEDVMVAEENVPEEVLPADLPMPEEETAA